MHKMKFEVKKDVKENMNSPYYHIFFLKNEEKFTIDNIVYQNPENSLLFITPYQNLQWLSHNNTFSEQIGFHGDYYCIEYHKKEVACNGILFNNIYLKPYVNFPKETFEEMVYIVDKMMKEILSKNPLSETVIKTYLQLIFAISSKEKIDTPEFTLIHNLTQKDTLNFQNILEQYFIKEKSVSFYADYLNLKTSTFSKKIKQQFGKSPSQLIQERTVLEAKKLLHLTTKNIREIAFELNFEDEFYFSRFFKKAVGTSPSTYRKQVGISKVAK